MIDMVITVKFFANFREAAGVDRVEIKDVEDVSALFEALVDKFGKKLYRELYQDKKLQKMVNVMVNGRGVDLQNELNKKLRDGDSVMIFPPVSGGSRSGGN